MQFNVTNHWMIITWATDQSTQTLTDAWHIDLLVMKLDAY